MSTSMHDQFNAFLIQLINDPDVIRKNSILSDSAYRDNLVARVNSQTPDTSIVQDYTNALEPTLGMMFKNTAERQLQFVPKGFSTYLSAFREGILDTPNHIFKLDGTGTEPRYVISDGTKGVIVANSELEALNRFPHYGAITSEEYSDPVSCVVWEQNSIKYIAIACYSHHIVQIYQWDDPYTWEATIGVLDTPGATPTTLNNPRGITVDPVNMRMYIACENGTPAGATLDRGFVTVFDLTTIGAPAPVAIPWFYNNTGSLLDGEVDRPATVEFDSGGNLLWVANGLEKNEVGAFDLTATSVNTLKRYIEPAGSGYTLRSPNQVYIYSLLGGYKNIYVVNGNTGTVEEFNYLNLKHQNSYGYRASEDDLNGYQRLSSEIYGALGTPTAVIADRVFIEDLGPDGTEVDVIIVGDSLNKRLSRFNLDAYSSQNWVNFALMEFQVPISVNGWTLSGDIPLDLVTVSYRNTETELWRDLPQEISTPQSSTFQFRVAVQLKPNMFIRQWAIRHLRIHAVQV